MKTMTRNKKMGIRSVSVALLAILSMLGALFVLPSVAHATPTGVDAELDSGSEIVIGGAINVPLDSPTNCDSGDLDFSYVEVVTPSAVGFGTLNCSVPVTGPPDADVLIECDVVYVIDTVASPQEVTTVYLVNCVVTIDIPDLSVFGCEVDGAAATLIPSTPAEIPGSGSYVDNDPYFPAVTVAGPCTSGAALIIDTAVGLGVDITLNFDFT